MKTIVAVHGLALFLLAGIGAASAAAADPLEAAGEEARNILTAQSPACPDCPAAGLLVGRAKSRSWGSRRVPLHLGRHLGRYRFVASAIGAGLNHKGTEVVMRLGPNRFELYECREQLVYDRSKTHFSYHFLFDEVHPEAAAFVDDNQGYDSLIAVTVANLPKTDTYPVIHERADPDEAIRRLGDCAECGYLVHSLDFGAVNSALLKMDRVDDSKRLVRDAPAHVLPSEMLYALFVHLWKTRGRQAAFEVLAEMPHLRDSSLEIKAWGEVAEDLMNRGGWDEGLGMLQDHRYASDDRRVPGSVERAKLRLAGVLAKAGRYEEARALAAGMSSNLNGTCLKFDLIGRRRVCDFYKNEYHGAYKAMAYRDLVVALAAHGKKDEAARIMASEFPKGDSGAASAVYDEAARTLDLMR